MNNFINIKKLEEDLEIYRVFNITRLLELFNTNKNTLVRPKLWDDPFENYILKSTGITSDGEKLSFGFQKDLYGQCWTLERESDAMWRIYSPDKLGVRVRTTVRKLHDSLYSKVSFNSELSAFIGKVLYKPQNYMVKQIKNRFEMQEQLLDTSGKGTVKTLLMKREEFKHEKEVRLVYYNHTGNEHGDLYKYTFNPHAIIDEIVFDPRMNDDVIDVFHAHLKSINFTGRVSKSPLYKLPNLKVSI